LAWAVSPTLEHIPPPSFYFRFPLLSSLPSPFFYTILCLAIRGRCQSPIGLCLFRSRVSLTLAGSPFSSTRCGRAPVCFERTFANAFVFHDRLGVSSRPPFFFFCCFPLTYLSSYLLSVEFFGFAGPMLHLVKRRKLGLPLSVVVIQPFLGFWPFIFFAIRFPAPARHPFLFRPTSLTPQCPSGYYVAYLRSLCPLVGGLGCPQGGAPPVLDPFFF